MLRNQLLNRRSFLKLAVIGGAGSAILAACTPKATPAPTEAPKAAEPTKAAAAEAPKAPAGAAELRMHVRAQAEGTKTEMGIEAFQKANPNITIKLEAFPGAEYPTKILTLGAGGTLGDLVYTHVGFYHANADAGFWSEMEPLVSAHNYDMSQFFEPCLTWMEWNGKIYALPYKGHSGTSLIWYNKTLIEEAGVTGDLKLNSYDELVELAKKITKDTNGDGKTEQWGYSYAGHTGWELLGPMRGAGVDLVEPRYGATKSLLNGEAQMQVISWLHDLIHVHKVTPLPGSAVQAEIFVAGQLGMRNNFLTASADQKAIGDKFVQAPAPMPPGQAGKLPGFYNFDQMAMNSKTKFPEETWQALTYFCGKEHGIRLGLPEGGGATSCGMRKDVYNDPDFRAKVPVIATVAEQLDQLEAHYWLDNLQTNKFWTTVGQALDKVMLDSAPVTQAALDEANAVCQNVMDEPRA
jgi:multiple sugar transport system substrate-binding protein